MDADKIRSHLKKKKDDYNYEIQTTDDHARKKVAKTKYYKIRKMLKEMSDAEIVSWYYEEEAKSTNRQRLKDETNRQNNPPRKPVQKISKKLADFADMEYEVQTPKVTPVAQEPSTSNDRIANWLSSNDFSIANETLELERESAGSSQKVVKCSKSRQREKKVQKSSNKEDNSDPPFFPPESNLPAKKPRLQGKGQISVLINRKNSV
ncbi:Oidioi.mRNA.OKI2018_I69.chr1.g3267.t1.cds [Oikopleura dioica]|uniref:Oidioi.mRNA.OKI2018_I69.chr1.g3267.t1.cds n=1 Tax=Oikopleura dioica TaxID=34765 RepID=A0ABN7SX50_OIKDI|nr:Oidioi.mRNA.OKI2018_I69.chr1.g3267.t1.cds [Oikopleura dioica]